MLSFLDLEKRLDTTYVVYTYMKIRPWWSTLILGCSTARLTTAELEESSAKSRLDVKCVFLLLSRLFRTSFWVQWPVTADVVSARLYMHEMNAGVVPLPTLFYDWGSQNTTPDCFASALHQSSSGIIVEGNGVRR